ncbi:helix-turn-helix domain-containing protein [Pedobacter sp. PLR]|uniref:helix-turn-helix domain-containing protein n=1 Tax=Pedobacter sp. PLR TaxID=2994465 RepID=UPI0022471A06|nr:helix-turn-helix domain-containing protein [Pedobacter sp. PLR]MCX2453389.1 helix-turn-helix domain-containing protein [Pedobacter sp. PLR]
MRTLNLILLVLRQLLKIHTDQLDALLKLIPVEVPIKEEAYWLHTEEVMEVFKKSRKTIYNWRTTGQLRFKQIGGTCYYLKADIYSLLKKVDHTGGNPG